MPMTEPETHPSLLVRLRDGEDQEAWFQFVRIYRPVIVRLAKIKGMQDADADDLAQRVLVSIAGAIGDFEPDEKRAKFRTWLKRIAENAIINALTRAAPDRGSADDQVERLLNSKPALPDLDSNLLRIEYRRELFHLAAEQIRDEFEEKTWSAFWMTAVENRDVNSVANELGIRRGNVYTARSRVMQRLKLKVIQLEKE